MTVSVHHRRDIAKWLLLAPLAAVALLAGPDALAQKTTTWVGGGVDGNWNDTGNWNNGTPAATGDTLVFDTSNNLTGTNNLPVTSVAGITYLPTAGAFNSIGTGTLTIAGNLTNNSTSVQTLNLGTTISGGQTVTVGSGGVMAFGSTGSALNQTITGSGVTVTLTGAGEARFLTNSSGTFYAFTPSTAASGSLVLNASALGTFTANVGTFRVGVANLNTSALTATTVRGAATTTITASSLQIGTNDNGSGSGSNDSLLMGTSGTINATNIVIGQKRSRGTLGFDSGLTNPTLTIRGAAGGSSKANITLGNYNTTNTVNSARGMADFSLGSIDAQLGTLVIGTITSGPGSGSAVPAATWIMGSGTVVADEVRLGYWVTGNVNTGTTASVTGTLSMSGGSFTAGSLRIADRPAGASSGTSRAIGIVNVTGGSLSVTGTFLLGANTGGGLASDQRGTLTITGGTVSSSVSITTTNAQSTLTLNGGVLNLNGNAIGSATQQIGSNGGAINFQSGTLLGVSEINGGGTFTKTTSGTLVLQGSNTWSGTTAINAGFLQVASANALAGSGTISFGGGTLQFSAANQADYSARIKASGAAMIINTNSQAVTFATGLDSTNTGGLTKSGAGTLIISATDGTYTGNTTFQGGSTQVAKMSDTGDASSLGSSGTIRWNGGSFSYVGTGDSSNRILAIGPATQSGGTTALTATINANGSGPLTLTGVVDLGTFANGGRTITLAGTSASLNTLSSVLTDGSSVFSLTKSEVGRWRISGSNSYTGTTTVNAGTLVAGNANAFGTGVVAVNSGTLDLDGRTVVIAALTGSSAGTITNSTAGAATLATTVASGNTTFAGVMQDGSGTVGLFKQGAGTLTLSGANTYSGQTQVSAGVLALGVANAIPNQSSLLVDGGGVNLAGFSNSVGALTLASGSIFGDGTLSGSSYALQGGRLDSILGTGPITVSSGTTTLGSGGRFNSASVLTISSGQLTLGGNETVASYAQSGGVLDGAGTVTASTYTLGGGTASANLGTGAITVTANSTLNGTAAATAVNLVSGMLTLGGGSRFTASTVDVTGSSGASLSLGGNESFGSLNGFADVFVGGNALTVGGNGSNDTYSGVMSGGGGLTKTGAGTLVLTAANMFSGTTTVSQGSLVVNGSLANTALVVAAGATLKGSGTIAGLTTISGTHAPGNSPGVETFTNLTYNAGSTVQWELWKNTASNSPLAYDQVVVTGDLNFSGASTTLSLIFTGSESPTNFSSVAWNNAFWDSSQEWRVYDVTGSTTGFGNLALATTNWLDSGGAAFQTARPDSSFSLENRSGDIYLIYTVAVVPEPGSIVLAGLGLAAVGGIAMRRRRRRA